MLPLTALRTRGLYRLISSTLDRYLLYEIVKHPARVLLIGCFKPPRPSRSRYLSADRYKLVSRLFRHNRISDGSSATLFTGRPKSIKEILL